VNQEEELRRVCGVGVSRRVFEDCHDIPATAAVVVQNRVFNGIFLAICGILSLKTRNTSKMLL
jgi:hypothetical protein